MGYSLKISGASFTNVIDRLIPARDALEGLWLFGDEVEAGVNQINGDPSTVLGTPTISNGIAYLGLNSGYDTGIVLPAAVPHTLVAVSNNVTMASSQGIVGMWHSNISGSKLYGRVSLAAGGSAVASVAAPSGPEMSFKAGTVSAGETVVYAHDGETLLSATGVGKGTSPANSFRIGGLNAAISISAAMLYSRALSSDEIAETYAYLKFSLGKRGVNIV